MSLADYVGVLGFVLALCVFVLTRVERRKSLLIEIRSDYSELFPDEQDDPEFGILLIRFINTSNKMILLDPQTITVSSNEECHDFRYNYGGWYGLGKPLSPLGPGDSCQVGLDLRELDTVFSIDHLSKDDVPLEVSVEDVTGKRFRSREKFIYLPEVSEIVRRKTRREN